MQCNLSYWVLAQAPRDPKRSHMVAPESSDPYGSSPPRASTVSCIFESLSENDNFFVHQAARVGTLCDLVIYLVHTAYGEYIL